MSVLTSILGLLFLTTVIGSTFGLFVINKKLKAIYKLATAHRGILAEMYIEEDLKDIKTENNFTLITLIIGVLFLITLCLAIDDHDKSYNNKPYISTTYSFDNNIITKTVSKCYPKKWDQDACKVITTDSKSAEALFND